jgi:tRNA G10  N-methylase Trm11
MIADPLATDLSCRFVKSGDRVLDPFCGTSRTLLAAAERGAFCFGIDVNPLAVLLSRAKASCPNVSVLSQLLSGLRQKRGAEDIYSTFNLEHGRRVEWFSLETKAEISSLIRLINDAQLQYSELQLVAAILSATVREVSYCKKNQWKLHRIPSSARSNFSKSPRTVFERRLFTVHKELSNLGSLSGRVRVIRGDARNLSTILKTSGEDNLFDLVLTSPPYGDSQTTVQYGGMSSICLGVLKHLRGLDTEIMSGKEIDSRCLGGKLAGATNNSGDERLLTPIYWHGGRENPARQRVLGFLSDIELSCQEIAKVLRQGGYAVFVIARRLAGGWRLYLDQFLIDSLARYNLIINEAYSRQIERKMTPVVINRKARGADKHRRSSRVRTMREEHILVFQKLCER